jgi:thioredoxin reductase (NADPH)
MPFDYACVVVGAGPAGLAAAADLAQAGHATLVLEKDLFGGALQHTAWIDDYPPFPKGISGADLAGKFIDQATSAGATVEHGDVSGVELFKRSRWVACSDGRGFSCAVVILACGTHYSRLGLPAEERFRGRGVVDCTPCDGGFFVSRDVVVYGSGDFAQRDARYLADLGARVTLLAPEHVRLDSIAGTDRLEGIDYTELASGAARHLDVDGLLVRLGTEPSSEPFVDLLDLDADGCITADESLETSAPFVLVCGDVRAGSACSVASAVADGERVAIRAAELVCRA